MAKPANKPNPYNAMFSGGSPAGGSPMGAAGGTERMIKAHRLYTHLRARGIKAEHLDNMHPNILAHHVASAGVGTPDDSTLAMVHQMLSQPIKPVT